MKVYFRLLMCDYINYNFLKIPLKRLEYFLRNIVLIKYFSVSGNTKKEVQTAVLPIFEDSVDFIVTLLTFYCSVSVFNFNEYNPENPLGANFSRFENVSILAPKILSVHFWPIFEVLQISPKIAHSAVKLNEEAGSANGELVQAIILLVGPYLG